MPYLKVEILLPLYYDLAGGSKGSERIPIEGEKYVQTYGEIVEKFGGCTIDNSPIMGRWINPKTGKEYNDQNTAYWVMCEENAGNVEFFRKLKETLKVRFQQEEIMMYYITVFPL